MNSIFNKNFLLDNETSNISVDSIDEDQLLKFNDRIRCIKDDNQKRFSLINIDNVPLDNYPIFQLDEKPLLQLFNGIVYKDLIEQMPEILVRNNLTYFIDNDFFTSYDNQLNLTVKIRKESNEYYKNLFPLISADLEKKLKKYYSNPNIPWSCYSPHPNAAKIEISLFITDMCNLKCSYCHVVDNIEKIDEKPKYYKDIMTDECLKEFSSKFLEYIKNRYNTGCLSIVFFGGQPALRGKVRDFLYKSASYLSKQAAKEKIFISFGIDDNGTQIDDDLIEFYKKYNFHVNISFDPPTYVNSKQRAFIDSKQDSGYVVDQGIKYLLEKEIPIGMRSTVSNLNQQLIMESVKYYTEVGLRCAAFIPMQDVAHGKKVNQVSSPNPSILYKEYKKAFEYILDLYKDKGIIFELGPLTSIIHSIIRGGKIQSCGMGDIYFAVSTTGSVYTCHRDLIDEFFITNVFDNEFIEKMNNIPLNRTCNTIFSFFEPEIYCTDKKECSCKNDLLYNCKNCEVLAFCGGLCPAASLAQYGCMNYGVSDLLDSNPNLLENRCKWSKKLIKDFFWRYIDSNDESIFYKYIENLLGGMI